MFLFKHYLRIVGLLYIILFCSSAYVLGNYYYYSAGEQKPLILSQEKVTVRFLASLTFEDVNNFILSEPALDPNKEPEPTFYDFYNLYVLPGNDIEALIQRLRSRQEVKIANPVYITADSTELYCTDRFVAQFYLQFLAPPLTAWTLNME